MSPNIPINTSSDSLFQFEALFNFATIGIVVTDSGGQIKNFNRFAEQQFGFTRDEAIGQQVELLLPAAARHRHEGYRAKYYKHPEPRVMGHGRDLLARKKDGATFPVEVSLTHYNLEGQLFVIAFVIDITLRKQQEAKMLEQTEELEQVTSEIRLMNAQLEQKVEDRTKMLQEALNELERSKEELNQAFENEKELSELKSRFVTMASHEFRTPLSTILSSAYLLDKYNNAYNDVRIDKHIHRIKGAVGGMKGILEDFLSLGRLEEGLVQTKMEMVTPLALDTLVQDLVQEMDGLLKNGQRIIMENTLQQEVFIDKYLVKNILINLLSNAIKFSIENGIVTVLTSISQGQFMLRVADNGIGIAEEDQQHLFTRFFRAKNAGNIEGTGLGLHIVAKYLELMNGSILMNSKLNEGTAFTITIPQPQSLLQ